jgi:hypothetical protein
MEQTVLTALRDQLVLPVHKALPVLMVLME